MKTMLSAPRTPRKLPQIRDRLSRSSVADFLHRDRAFLDVQQRVFDSLRIFLQSGADPLLLLELEPQYIALRTALSAIFDHHALLENQRLEVITRRRVGEEDGHDIAAASTTATPTTFEGGGRGDHEQGDPPRLSVEDSARAMRFVERLVQLREATMEQLRILIFRSDGREVIAPGDVLQALEILGGEPEWRRELEGLV